ncbi:SDR family NAD(P)-dependent oxidoreductase [Hyphococcus formosus]|uniref:SDR family NAD(P)-dependent oxidoreductase n=1 Tax=Hyphococcus formosus TaxID=3143534 RepID=UPI00398ABD7F
MNEKIRLLLKLFTPQRRKPDPRHAMPKADRDLSGKTIVFTGGTDGIGRVAVSMLYEMGASLVLLGRDTAKGESIVKDLAASDGRGTATFERCDLSSLQSVKECGDRILATQPQIDALVNCAGVNAMTDRLSQDGFATNWAVNYLAPVLLTRLLLGRLRASAPARIVNLTTDTAYLDRLDLDMMETDPTLGQKDSYAGSKLALEMFSVDLAHDLKSFGVTVNLQHPGYIRSNLLRNLRGIERVMQGLMRIMASPTEVGADRIVRQVASSAFAGVTGVIIAEDQQRPHHAEVGDTAKRERLARLTDKILALWL